MKGKYVIENLYLSFVVIALEHVDMQSKAWAPDHVST